MGSDFIIRKAVLADSQTLFKAHQDSVQNLCSGAYSEAQIAVWFEGSSPEIYRPAIEAHEIWLAERSGRVLGFVGFAPRQVTLLFVRKESAGLGLGKRLFALGLETAESGSTEPLTVVATQNSACLGRHVISHESSVLQPAALLWLLRACISSAQRRTPHTSLCASSATRMQKLACTR